MTVSDSLLSRWFFNKESLDEDKQNEDKTNIEMSRKFKHADGSDKRLQESEECLSKGEYDISLIYIYQS